MKKLDNIRSNQNLRQSKSETKKIKKEKSRRRAGTGFRVFVIALKCLSVLMLVAIVGAALWFYSLFDFSFGDDFTTFDMRLSSTIYYSDKYGNLIEYEQFKSSEKRIWVDIEDVPKDLQHAFVAIEDERFYSHSGVDLKRTLGAAINVFLKGDSSYGGSSITQQLVKNITKDNERTSSRKLREITRAIVLESKMDKEQILEMYMNSIYLSQGVHGVQAAANVYFGKDVSKLSLAECACIAGITQYPTTYDPIVNPKNNKKKQLLVLGKMLELGYINNEQYNDAASEELVFENPDEHMDDFTDDGQSYFADYIFEQAKADLMKEFDYTEQFAEDLLCNGGLKIYATVDPEIQSTMEEYYENDANFPNPGGSDLLQSAMVVMEPSSGEIKGIVGGRGKKDGLRVLNRASMSKRQPGSSIKPIAVYAPALEENVINLSSYVGNSKITIGTWTPKNSNGNYTPPVPVKTAVAWSYNVPAVNVLKEMGIDVAFDYLKNKLHISSIIDSVTRNGKEYSDKNLSLALGGMTDGATPLEMTAAYSAIANGGMYIEPTSYTKIYDRNGKLFYEKKQQKNRAFSKETAFLTHQLLFGVTSSGTAAGSKIGQNDTCGKTGTTDKNMDKWFIGYTPHYCAGVWFGYDKPKAINTGTNPSITVWKNIMTKIHEDLDPETFEAPKGIVKAKVCPYTGMYESYSAQTEYANSEFLTGYCGGKNHSKYVGWTKDAPIYSSDTKKEDTEKKEENDGETSSNDGESNTSSSNDVTETESPTPPVETPEPPPAPSEPTDIPHI
ncbi:MAG: penicillin-binding protein [Clostridia bacterium]|nr:penicillin-binding protein [Clostridia bacterium]